MSADPQSRPPGADPGPEPAIGADDQDEADAESAEDGGSKPFQAPEGYELL
ncbi:MAG TPA: hypothetical protein VGH27_08255 [Streptosporangiaceae bacterium]